VSARPLGLFAALALSPAALAGEPTVTLSYEPVRTDTGWNVKIYAQNTGNTVVMVDDDPYVEKAEVQAATGPSVNLVTKPDFEMISRAGPRRNWMAVKPGERMLVGTSELAVPEHTVIQNGTMVLTVRLVTKDGYSERTDKVPLTPPGT
jgi:hypothetical protein